MEAEWSVSGLNGSTTIALGRFGSRWMKLLALARDRCLPRVGWLMFVFAHPPALAGDSDAGLPV